MRVQLQGHIEERAGRLAEEQRQAREMEIARQIQQSMLPVAADGALDGRYAIAATLRPAREVGGDLYDFFVSDERRLIFAIADVADKGVPAALLMARVTGLLRAIAPGETGPDGILRELDVRLSQGNDACMFVTAACGQLDGETGEVRYASAGHEPPILRRADGTTAVLALGGRTGPRPGRERRLSRVDRTLRSRRRPRPLHGRGDRGVRRAGDAFGLERLRRVVAETPADALRSLPDRLVDAVERFAAGGASPRRPGGARGAVPADRRRRWAARRRVVAAVGHGAHRKTWLARSGGSRAILRARDVPAPTVHDCVLAAEELLTNIATHAYGGQPGREARVEIRLLPEEIQIRFEDAGPPFNPLEQPAPDLEAPLATRPVGGLGILLVRQLVDRWEYAREGATNIVTAALRPAGRGPV